MYEKPQVAQSGAFHWAIDNEKPILPVFATFKPNGEANPENPEANHDITVHFGQHVVHDPKLDREQNIANMIRMVFLWQKGLYEKEYGKELNYNCSPEINVLIKKGVSASVVREACRKECEGVHEFKKSPQLYAAKGHNL